MKTKAAALLLLASCLSAAESAAPERPIRAAEGKQKSIANMTVASVKELQGLIDEYRINGIGNDAQLATLGKLSDALSHLADPGANDKNMLWVAARLGNARQIKELEAIKEELLAAGQGQDAIVDQLNKLILDAKKKFGSSASGSLKNHIKEQEKLLADTQEQGDKTLGKDRNDLTKEEAADNEKIAKQQDALQKALDSTIDDLKNQANEMKQTDPDQAKALEDALKDLQDQNVQDQMDKAAQDIADNKLNAAQEKQQEVLDALKKAQNKMDSSSEDPMDKLEKDLAQIGDMIDRQSDLMKQTDGAQDQKDLNDLQAKENNLKADTQDLQDRMQQDEKDQLKDAAKNMDDAQKDLGEQQKQKAKENMKKALDALAGAEKKMKDRLDQMRQDRMNDQDPQMQDSKLSQEERDLQALNEALDEERQLRDDAADMKDKDQADFDRMKDRQKQVRDKMKDLAQADKAKQKMDQAQQDLAQMLKDPALKDMDEAIDEMQKLKDELEQKLAMNPMAPKPAQKSDQKKMPGQEQKYAGKKGSEKTQGWKVGLQPSERQSLQESEKEKFPRRYEEQLQLYYRNLAGGAEAGQQ